MNFDWLVSFSTALFASVLGVGGDIKEPKILESNEKVVIEKPVDTSKVATEADLINALGEKHLEKFIPRKELLSKSKKKLTKEVLVKELVEVVESKLPKDFVYPPIKEVTKFRDISRENPIFEAASKLKSLEILPENKGLFGKPNDKNPEVKISEMKQVVHKAFDKEGELNFFQDKDLDGVPNSLDACPDLPSNKGCPDPIEEKDENFPNDTVLEVSEKVKVVEQKEIEKGDIFSAIIFDPTTGEVFTESEPLIVSK